MRESHPLLVLVSKTLESGFPDVILICPVLLPSQFTPPNVEDNTYFVLEDKSLMVLRCMAGDGQVVVTEGPAGQ